MKYLFDAYYVPLYQVYNIYQFNDDSDNNQWW